ncbi:TIGR04076 family protein [Streptomyces sp. NPDC047000]|uniref:TIGR04076 family protein n=1 Tax=Streptomyces sp. NPDC047000 TaxID=3155474 RepID=UPI0033F044CB
MSGIRVRCTVEAMNYSACGLEIGDWFETDSTGLTVPEGKRFCYFAVASVLPAVLGRLDAAEPDGYLRGEPLLACPDPPEGLHMRVTTVTDREPDDREPDDREPDDREPDDLKENGT